MDNPAEAPIAAQETIRKDHTMSHSTHDNTDDICADEGQTDDVHNHTVSHTSASNTNQIATTKRFCTFAVNTGLTESPGLPPELRLKVYKAAFPEMDRPIVDENIGHIEYETSIECQGDCDPDYCSCFRDRRWWNNRLQEAFTSNFARDPTTRVEFLTEYLRRVRICMEMEGHDGRKKSNMYLWRFLSVLATSGLLDEMKHLTLETDLNVMKARRPKAHEAYEEIEIGHVCAVLFRFRVKCELSFHVTMQAYEPVLGCIAEIVEANFSRDEIDKYFTSSCSSPYHRKYLRKMYKLFNENEVLLRSIDRFDSMPCEQWRELDFTGYLVMKYVVDFSE